MKKRPRPASETCSGQVLLFGLFQGAVVLGGVHPASARSPAEFRRRRWATASSLVAANLILAFADSAEVGTSFFDRRRIVFWAIGAIATAILAAILLIPAAARMFSVSLPQPSMIALAFGVALVSGGWYGFLRRAGLA
jgi:Ca2+-transporting ATPase